MNNYMFFLFRFYNKKRTYDPIDYASIDETDFWIVDENEPVELDVEELENLLYEEGKQSGRLQLSHWLVEYLNL